MQIPVPETGNRSFERVLKSIELSESVRPAQITKFIAPRSRLIDPVDISRHPYPHGVLQQRDLREVRGLFKYPDFVIRVIASCAMFEHEEARVFQFHQPGRDSTFVFGLFVTDSRLNLVDLCLETPRRDKRRAVLQPLIRAICTPESVKTRLH